MIDIEAAVDTARQAARVGGEAAMAHFGGGLAVERKADRSPVTVADRASEAAILEVLLGRYPETPILTEESGVLAGTGVGRWIVDPLDGTRGFTRGGEHWGPLVALEWQGEVVAGAMALPALGRNYWAGRGMGTYRDGERLQVSAVADWSEAVLSLGELPGILTTFPMAGLQSLIEGAYLARCYGDLAGCALVLDGFADAWLEAGVKAWDLAPLALLIEEAGGRFSDRQGRATIESGNAVASNGLLHGEVLAALS